MKKKLLVVLCCLSLVQFAVSAEAVEPNFYVQGNIGYTAVNDADLTVADEPASDELSFDGGWNVSAAAGVKLGNGRVEGEIGYRTNDFDEYSGSGEGVSEPADGEISNISFMVNGYYDIPTGTAVTPYVGGGIGVARIEIEPSGESYDDTVFAYQGAIGVGIAVSKTVTIDLGYRYFATTDPDFEGTEVEYKSHNLLAGVRIVF
jgi:opacity protein-like surface antigen